MKYEDYEKSLTEMITSPDTAPATVQTLLAAIKEDLTKIDSLMADSQAKDKRISDLQQTNVQLLMTQTGQPPAAAEEVHVETIEEKIERLAKEYDNANT